MLYPQVDVPAFSMREVGLLAVARLIPLYVGAKPCT